MRFLAVFLAFLALSLPGSAQSENQRLILKDGSYQVVREYQKVGDRVRYFSTERDEWEEIPAAMVDWAATETWAKDHAPGAHVASPAASEAAKIDQEEQLERSRTPDVLPGLRLPDEQGIWALDTFRGQPELAPLEQNTGNVNRQTGHNVLRSDLTPTGGIKQAIEIPGGMSKVQLHVNEPVFYVSLSAGNGRETSDSSAFTVETNGAPPADTPDSYSSPKSQYVIVPLQSNRKHTYRAVRGVQIGSGGKLPQAEGTIPTTAQVLAGNHWMKLTPREPLTMGEYALIEILAPGEVNASVWDFRVDPMGPDNGNAIMPLGHSD